MTKLALKMTVFTIVIPAILAALLPLSILERAAAAPEHLGSLRYLGLLPILAGAAGYLAYSAAFSLRSIDAFLHPMSFSLAAVLFGEALFTGAPALLGYAAGVGCIVHGLTVLRCPIR